MQKSFCNIMVHIDRPYDFVSSTFRLLSNTLSFCAETYSKSICNPIHLSRNRTHSQNHHLATLLLLFYPRSPPTSNLLPNRKRLSTTRSSSLFVLRAESTLKIIHVSRQDPQCRVCVRAIVTCSASWSWASGSWAARGTDASWPCS